MLDPFHASTGAIKATDLQGKGRDSRFADNVSSVDGVACVVPKAGVSRERVWEKTAVFSGLLTSDEALSLSVYR